MFRGQEFNSTPCEILEIHKLHLKILGASLVAVSPNGSWISLF